jgi:hypothetical protein
LQPRAFASAFSTPVKDTALPQQKSVYKEIAPSVFPTGQPLQNNHIKKLKHKNEKTSSALRVKVNFFFKAPNLFEKKFVMVVAFLY